MTAAEFVRFLSAWFDASGIAREAFAYQGGLAARWWRREPVLVNKARQTGISTLMAFLGVWGAVSEGWPVLVASNREENASHILEYASVAWAGLQKLPLSGLPSMDTDKATRLSFSNGGDFRALSANAATDRGFPAKFVILDEFSHIRGEIGLDKKMLKAITPSVSQMGGFIWVASTPNGMANEFARMWHSPDTPETSKVTIHYSECPSLKVRVEDLPHGKRYWVTGAPAPLPEPDFMQEYCNYFDPGSGTAIPTDAIWDPKVMVGDEEAWE